MGSSTAMTRSKSDQQASFPEASSIAPKTLPACEGARLVLRCVVRGAMSSFSSLQPAPSAARERAAASSSATASATEGGEASERSAAESRSESDSDGERAVRDGPARTESCDTMSAPRLITSSERAEQPRPRTRRQPPKASEASEEEAAELHSGSGSDGEHAVR